MSLFKYDPKLIKHKGRYNVRFYDPETRRRKMHSLGTDNKDVAQRRYREIVRAYELGEFNPAREKYQFGFMTLRLAANGFLSARKSEWADATYTDYKNFLNMICEMLPADMHLRHLSPSDCKKIVRQPPSREGQRGYYRRLRSFLNWCRKEGYLKVTPLEDVKQPKKRADQRVPFLTRPEFVRYVKAIDEAALLSVDTERAGLERLSRAVRFDVATGLRLSELCKIRWRDVDRQARRIHVVGKGEKYRTIPLFPDAADVLQEIEAAHVDSFGTPPPSSLELFPGLPYYDTSHDITRFLKATGLKDKIGQKATHAFRHTFASWVVMASVDIFTLSKWLGHASISTTMMYAHLAPGYAPDAAISAFSSRAENGGNGGVVVEPENGTPENSFS